jgi:hypothetical protein
VKKIFLFCVLALTVCAFTIGCSKSDSSSKKNNYGLITNYVDGMQMEFVPTSNNSKVSSDDESIILVAGETYSFATAIFLRDEEDKDSYIWDYYYDTSNSVWNVKGDIGYIGTQGTAYYKGSEVSLTITAAAGSKGAIALEFEGMTIQYPVRIVATVEDFPKR